jgi:hypothetical protein
MYILYIDPSGVPELEGAPSHYAMVGVCLHEGTWFAFQKRVNGLKRQYALPGKDIELHAKDFAQDYPEQNNIPNFSQLDWWSRRAAVESARQEKLKAVKAAALDGPSKKKYEELKRKYRQTNGFIHLSRGERSKLLEDSLDLVGSHDGVRLFGEVVDKAWLFHITGERNSLHHAFSQIVSRFDAFLTRYNQDPSVACNGIIVMDREPTYENYIAEMFKDFRLRGHPYGQLNHVIDTPFFIDSKAIPGIQIVDICSYAVRRYIGSVGQGKPHEEQNFLRIYHQFDREGPRLHGLRHYCEKGRCQCLVCSDRGHA